MARTPENSIILGEALAGASEAVFVTTPKRVITAANAAAYGLLAYTPPSLTGQQVRALYAANDDYAIVDAAIADGSSVNAGLPVTLRDRAGRLLDAQVLALPLRDANGTITSIIEIMTPMPSDTAADATDAARNRTELLRFARGAAHDFKNLLTIIISNMELAEREKDPIRRRRLFEDARYASGKAADLSDKMIAFARGQPRDPAAIDVRQFLSAQAPIWHALFDQSAKLSFDVAEGLPMVTADRSGLENALLNLVINARDAIAGGGDIVISATTVERVTIDGLRSYVAIAVRDTGIGMTDHVRNRAFDPFFSTKSAANGSGLGLATVLGFAEQSGGHVSIDSKPGAGATLTIFLPPNAA